MSGLPHGSVPMAVPSSYNDLLENTQLREHVGLVWYERECFVPLTWRDRRVVLFVGSANHHASVWLNGKRIGEHDGGRAPKTAKARGKPQANPGQAWGQDDLRLLL